MCVKVFFQKILPVFTEFPVFALVMFDRGNLVPFCLPKKEPKRLQAVYVRMETLLNFDGKRA